MFNNIRKFLEKPPLYKKTEGTFWNDEYISKQLLKAHLDSDFEGASRPAKFMEDSALWINKIVPSSSNPLLLDIGCGPGIYAEKFTKLGYQVTGVDFSKRSIDYGRTSARNKSLNIHYVYQNYLEMDLQKKFDFITMIYCDYGALATHERMKLLENVHHHLKSHGRVLLDVFSIAKFNAFEEKQIWETFDNGGFWREESYIALDRCCKYASDVTLEQTTILTNKKTTNYYVWTTYFTKERLIKEVTTAGFKVCDVFGDVKGSPYKEDSLTMAVLLEKI